MHRGELCTDNRASSVARRFVLEGAKRRNVRRPGCTDLKEYFVDELKVSQAPLLEALRYKIKEWYGVRSTERYKNGAVLSVGDYVCRVIART
jgi:hypothetical protein